ncbi:MAG: carboxypeptidase-like regulatory domain-containing protein [Gemmatimonadota bacterium]
MSTTAITSAHRFLATLLTLLMALGPPFASHVPAQAGGGSIRGIIYESDGTTRLVGATVMAIDVKTGTRYTSDLTGENGAYRIAGLPAGTYDVVVESGGILFVAANLIDLGRNQQFSVSYSIQPQKPASREIEGLPSPAGAAELVGEFRGVGPAGAARESFWTSPWGIVTIGVIALGVGLLVGDDDEDGSPSGP